MRHLLPLALLLASGSTHLFASLDPGLLAMVPENARIVASVDLTSGKNSELGRYFDSRTQRGDRRFEDFVQTTGFDPRRDLQYFLFESSDSGSGGTRGSWSMLARGTFDPERLRALLTQKGAVTEDIQGVPVLLEKNKKANETAICFPDTGVALMGDLATIQNILVNRASPSALDPALRQQIDAVASSNDVWFASLSGPAFLKHQMGFQSGPSAQAAQAFQAILQSSGGIRLGPTVNITLDAVTRSPQDANSLSDVIRFLAGMVQSQSPNDPRATLLASALANLNLTTSGPAIHIALAVPEKTLEQFAISQDRPTGHAHTHPAQ